MKKLSALGNGSLSVTYGTYSAFGKQTGYKRHKHDPHRCQ